MSGMAEFLAMSRPLIEKESRAAKSYAYIGQGRGLTSLLGGRIRLFVAANDLSLTPCFIMDGFWESWVTKAMGSVYLKDKIVIDIGANAGYYSLVAMALGARKVISYEPQPFLSDLIIRSATVNGFFGKYDVRCAAVGAKRGSGWIHQPQDAGGLLLGSAQISYDLSCDMPAGSAPTKCSIEPLDPAELADADLIKIDAEGFEQQIWRGAEFSSMKKGAVVLLEYSRGAYEGNFAEEIAASGFSINIVRTDGSVGKFSVEEAQQIQDFEMLWLVKQ